MKELNCSNLERDALLKSLGKHQRLDGRGLDDTREISIRFFSHCGSVSVTLGETHVIAQISSKIVKPKETRANIGIIRIYLDTSNIPYVNLDRWKHSEYGQQLNQILERNICQSECIDLESLCIVAGDFVWAIKIDLSVLNNGGNILDCANLATLCALSHYRLPEVSVRGTDVHVFSENERYPRPLRILFYPINVTFAFLAEGAIALVDPSSDEERQMDALVAISSNQRREICGFHICGSVGLKREQIEVCQQVAYRKAYELSAMIDAEVQKHYKIERELLKAQASVVRTDEDDETLADIEPEARRPSEVAIDRDISLILIAGMQRLAVEGAERSSGNPKDTFDEK